ncbi:MAG TPA: AGE family epimerase/isomerase [Bryobacteraceae bacterium]|nr:AGE family epimerase/isomerase [Bryobacteraceae bacterium]
MPSLESYARRYRSELLDRVIPFWLRHSLDRQYGGYFTCLTREGKIYDTRKYIWLQGRAVWMFSKLYNELDPRPEFLDAARLIFDFLLKNARDPQGRYYFSLTREGRPAFYQRKPYAAVFAMLGMLEFSKAINDHALRQEAIDLFWQIRKWIQDPTLLGRPPQLPSLADVMVTVSMTSEIAKVDPDPRYREILRECLQSARIFYEPRRRIFLEYPPSDTPEGRLFCPGDSIEASWFLLHADPDPEMRALLLDSIEGALEFGWDKEYGGLYYFMDVEGLPPLPLESNMKLWWPHTEAIYATILAHSLTSDPKWLTWLERIDAYAFAHFSDPEHGEWFGYCDRRGELTNTAKGNNYKGCFHVPRMLLLSYQLLSQAPIPPR